MARLGIVSTLEAMRASSFKSEISQAHINKDGFIYVQPKIDGMRIIVNNDGLPITRSGLIHPNKFVQELCSQQVLKGVDGELLAGHIMTPESFRESMSGIRAADGVAKFTLWVFDQWISGNRPFEQRWNSCKEDYAEKLYSSALNSGLEAYVKHTPTHKVSSIGEIMELYEMYLSFGFEGVMLRRRTHPYKHGKSTALQGHLTKLKPFEDAEAIIIGYEPWYVNENELKTSQLGYSKRSAHQEYLKPVERLGAFIVELLPERKVQFKIGVLRCSHDDRDRMWEMKDQLLGQILTFSHQGIGGGYDKPRTPVGLRFRGHIDLDVSDFKRIS